MANRRRAVGVVLSGLKGEIIVNGQTYNGEMPAIQGSDINVASVLTYVRGQFNDAEDSLGVEEVAEIRAGGVP